MSKIKVSRFYKNKSDQIDSDDNNDVQLVFVPDVNKSECSEMETDDSDDNVPLSNLVPVNARTMAPDIESESSESVIESSDADDNSTPPTAESQPSTSRSTGTSSVVSSRWRKRQPHYVNSDFKGEPFPDPPLEDLSPRNYFDMFFDTTLYEIIADETNLYSTQVTGKCINTNSSEIEQFIGILLTMGILKYPQYRMYWSQYTRCNSISEIMPLKRFESLKRFFHLNDNDKMPKKDSENYDVLYKVRPLLDLLHEKCLNTPHEECHAIDEQIIPTKSRCPIRQYLPNKPNKWGIKVWARCGVSGFLYDFSVYLGKQDNTDTVQRFGKIGAVVLNLAQHIPQNVGHKIYMDNLFSSLDLFSELKNNGIWAVGTIRNNRLKGAEKLMKSKQQLAKEGRGSLDYRVDANTNTTVIRWIDNGMVQALSTFIGPEMGENIGRWSGKEKKVIDIPCPQIIHEYNKHMGGVDLCDMLMSLYRIELGTKKWYMHIVYYCIGVAVTNGWILYKRHCHQNGITQRSKLLTLLEFQARIADSLLHQRKPVPLGRPRYENKDQPPKRRRSANSVDPISDIQFDNVGHLPVFDKNKTVANSVKQDIPAYYV